MPLPVGHSMMGYAMYESLGQDRSLSSWRMALLFMILANLPDLDFLPGLLLGEPNLYHRHYLSHSPGMAILVGFAVALFFHVRKLGRFLPCFAVFSTVYFSHVLLDFFGVDRTAPIGVPILWPLTQKAYLAPFSVFMAVQKSNSSGTFLQSLFIGHNFLVALWEFILFAPVLAAVKLVKRRRAVFAWIGQKL